jgi:hypothetical protein
VTTLPLAFFGQALGIWRGRMAVRPASSRTTRNDVYATRKAFPQVDKRQPARSLRV